MLRLVSFTNTVARFTKELYKTNIFVKLKNNAQLEVLNKSVKKMKTLVDFDSIFLTRGPRGPWNAHLRQKIFKSSLFSLLYVQQATRGGLNLKAIVLKFKSNVCKRIF